MTPLSDVRVLDLSRIMAGPYCSMMLGDMGADVIKVEQPGKGDDTRGWGPPFIGGESVYYLSVNRNKRSITIDLKSPEGKEVLWRLVDRADVLLENFSPGTVGRLGFAYEEVAARKPDIVYCSISGFGQTGPSRDRTAYDLVLQGLGGLMSVTGQEDGPPTRGGVPIADLTAGMMAAFSITTAMYHRARTGEGQFIDSSLLGGQVALLTYQAGAWFATGRVPGRIGNRHPMITPYDTFRTSDGWINLAVGNDSLWWRFCAAIDAPHLGEDERFATNAGRTENREALYSLLVPLLLEMPSEEVIRRCTARGVPCAEVADVGEVMSDPQVLHMGFRTQVEHPLLGRLDQTGIPNHFSKTPGGVRRHPPRLGEHTDEVLAELGYSEPERALLWTRGCV